MIATTTSLPLIAPCTAANAGTPTGQSNRARILGTAVAAMAAKAAVSAYVFYPDKLEDTKARACRALGAKVCQLQGNYDQANRACRALAEATDLEFANITLRPFYAEGAKTDAFEIVEQLGWLRLGASAPSARYAPAGSPCVCETDR